MAELEIWCWPRIYLKSKSRIVSHGHVELRVDRFYSLLPDKDKRIEVNASRQVEKDDAFYGRFAGILRITDKQELISSYEDIYRRLIDLFSRRGESLKIEVFVAKIEVSDEVFDNLILYFEQFKGKVLRKDSEYLCKIEYFYKSEGESKNCVTLTLDALRNVGIFDDTDVLGGDGFWPDDLIELLRDKAARGDLVLWQGAFRPPEFIVEKEVF